MQLAHGNGRPDMQNSFIAIRQLCMCHYIGNGVHIINLHAALWSEFVYISVKMSEWRRHSLTVKQLFRMR